MTQEVMSTAGGFNDQPLPRRNAPKGLLPSTWLNRSLRVEYVTCDGGGAIATGALIDWFPFGPAMSVNGARMLISWDAIRVIELQSD